MITLSGIEKIYEAAEGPVTALRGISLSVAKGEIFGIVGLSGAGKSTLIRCINLLERPTRGTVVVDGLDMTSLSDAELREARKSIGMIFQHFNLLSSATVYDNVAFPLRLSGLDEAAVRKRVEPLLSMVALSDMAHRYPSQLSGGQKQRVGIARALAPSPKVLLSDEATSALDPQTTKSILSLIGRINRELGLTVVIITHEMQVIKDICDKVAVIENGRIVEEGRVIDVFTGPKMPITKEFIGTVMGSGLPPAVRDVPISSEPFPGGKLIIRLALVGAASDTPIITALARKFPVDATILYGNFDAIKDTPYGNIVLNVSGDTDALAGVLSYLGEMDLKFEVIGYVS